MLYLCPRKAQMAESVDALVSNTSGATRAGSTPALGTENGGFNRVLRFSFYRLLAYIHAFPDTSVRITTNEERVLSAIRYMP